MSDAARTTESMHRSGTIEITADDLLAAKRLHFRKGLSSRRLWMQLALVWGTAALAFALFILVVDGPEDVATSAAGFALCAPLVVAGVFLTIYALAIPINARRAYAQQRSLREPATYTITDDALILENASGTARLHWRDVHMAHEGETLVLVYESDQMFRLLPKRYLTPEDLQALRRATGLPARRLADDDAFAELDNLVQAYLNQDLHESYDTVEEAIADRVRRSADVNNRGLLQEMRRFEALYQDEMKAEFARRYEMDFDPQVTGLTVPQFFDVVRRIIADAR